MSQDIFPGLHTNIQVTTDQGKQRQVNVSKHCKDCLDSVQMLKVD